MDVHNAWEPINLSCVKYDISQAQRLAGVLVGMDRSFASPSDSNLRKIDG